MNAMTGSIDLMSFLADVALRGAIVLAVGGLVSLSLRRASSAARHLVWTLTLLGVLTLPVAEGVLPRISVKVPVWVAATTPSPNAPEVGTDPILVPGAELSEAREAAGDVGAPAAGDASFAAQVPADGGSPLPDPTATLSTTRPAPSTMASAAAIGMANAETASSVRGLWGAGLILVLWLLGVLALLLPVVVGWLAVRRLERRSRRLNDGRIRHLATRLALRLGIRRSYRLLLGPPRSMPMTWGVFRPRVALPQEAVEWSDARLEAVLSHELAHVARRDVLTQYLAEVARAIHWFNPLAWVAAWRLRVEREHACDDVALAGGSLPADYAEELLALARQYRATPASSMAAVAMARPGQLADRLLAVLDETRHRGRLGRATAVRAAVVAVAVVIPLAVLAPTASGAEAEPTPAAEPVPEPAIELATGSPAGPVTGMEPGRAPARIPAPQERTCATSNDDWESVSSRSNNGRHTITLSRPGCELEARLEGDLDFDGASIGIARMGRDARMRIIEDDGRTERRLDITPGRGGEPGFDFRVNGRDAEFDSAARAWYRAVLLVLFRRAGFAAEERVEALLEQGGVDSVLREVDRLHSSYVVARYITLLAERADLSEAQWRGLVELSFERVDSDHYLAQILGTVAAHQPMTPALMDRFIAAAMKLDSDHYRTQVLTGVLESGRLSTEQVGEVLRATTAMDSDHYRTLVLTAVADQYALEPDFRATYLSVTADMDSDHYRTLVLTHLLDRNDLSAEEKADVIRAADTIDSDHYRTEVLKKVVGQGIDDPALQRAFFQTAAGLDSDHYYTQAMLLLLERQELEPSLLVNVLRASGRQVESDHYLSQILMAVLDRHAVTGAAREAFLEAMDAIESDHYRGLVADELLRQERG